MRKAGFVLDAVAVLVFVLIGRAVHAGGITASGLTSTVWPFASGLALGWIITTLLMQSSSMMVGGLAVWISTVGIGMALRVVSGQGTDFPFVLVALGFLGATMLGWRIMLQAIRRLRPALRARR